MDGGDGLALSSVLVGAASEEARSDAPVPPGGHVIAPARGAALLVFVLGVMILLIVLAFGSQALALMPESAAAGARYATSVVAVVGLVTLAAMVLAWFVSRAFTSDIGSVTRGVARLVRQVRSRAVRVRPRPLAPRGFDELGALLVAFDGLQQSLHSALIREEELHGQSRRASRHNEEFLLAVSHELRTPLNAILGFAEVLLDEIDGPLDESQREDVRIIRSAGMHLRALFEDVLDLSAAASGNLELERAPVSLEPLVRQVFAELAGQSKPHVELDVVVDSTPLPPIIGDAKRLRQVVTNLATNALKFTDAGYVIATLHAEGPEVVLEIGDTGVGISAEALDRIFVEFDQIQGTRRAGGAGLGLSIAKELVELHAGHIEAESIEGRGSVFRVRIPHVGAA